MELDATLTLILFVVSSLFAAGAGYMGARPPSLKHGPRMIPWRFLMLLFAVAAIVLLVHLLTVLGLKTEPPSPYHPLD